MSCSSGVVGTVQWRACSVWWTEVGAKEVAGRCMWDKAMVGLKHPAISDCTAVPVGTEASTRDYSLISVVYLMGDGVLTMVCLSSRLYKLSEMEVLPL